MTIHFFRQINKSFAAKIFSYLLGAMILITATFTFFYLRVQLEYLENEMVKDGKILTGISANNARLGIFAQDRNLLSTALRTAISVDGVIGACAYDNEGQLLHRDFIPGWEQSEMCLDHEKMAKDALNHLQESHDIFHFENKNTISFWSIVSTKSLKFSEENLYFKEEANNHLDEQHVIGYVRVIFDKAPITKSIREILVKNFLILLVFLVIGCVAAHFIVQRITRPLNKLITGIKFHGLKDNGKDEFGLLADTFSGMVKTLGDSFETINELKDGLEKKVQELESEISKRKEIESNLRESEEKFRSISEGIADGVAIVIDKNIAWYNNAFSAILGYESVEFDHEAVTMLLQEHNLLNHSFRKESESRVLVETRKRNGQRIFIEVNAQKIVFEKQEAIQLIIRDITELNEAEKKRKEMEVKALGQSKLASLGKIATSVAHEINQPLSFIKIAYESILHDIEKQRFETDEAKENCIESLRQVARISTITDHLRNFGRTNTLSFSEIQIADVIANSLTLMGETIRLADISLIREIDENLPPVIANSVKLEQVFINLFQNSIDAMTNSSEKKIKISIQQAGKMIEILFSDTGPGISPDVVQNIFEPFFTTKRLEDRTGLGLGIIYNIINEHKGTIEYRQITDWGASFLILLPTSSE